MRPLLVCQSHVCETCPVYKNRIFAFLLYQERVDNFKKLRCYLHTYILESPPHIE